MEVIVSLWEEFVKNLRKHIDPYMTQKEFAEKIGASSGQDVSRWERGVNEPSRKMKRTLTELARKVNFQIPEGLLEEK